MVETPQKLFLDVLSSTGDRMAAIRSIREKFGLSIEQAKEVMLQAEGISNSLAEHQHKLAPMIEQLAKELPDEHA